VVAGWGCEADTLPCHRFVDGKLGLGMLLSLPLEGICEALLSQVLVPQLREALMLGV